MKSNTIKKNYLSESAYSKLKDLILSGEIKEGKIDQNKLVDIFSISKTPILIALHQLEIDGYLEKIPNKGFHLKKYGKEDLKELEEIRILFESFGAEKLIQNITEEKKDILIKFKKKLRNLLERNDINNYNNEDRKFHEYLVENSNNNTIIKLFKKFHNIFKKFTVANFLLLSEAKIVLPLELTLEQHDKIIDSIIALDIQEAKTNIKDHLETVTRYLEKS